MDREERLRLAYDAHASSVMGIAVRVLGDRDLARDVCQETFVRFHDHDVEDVGAWLRTVAWRLALDILRKRESESRALAARPLAVGDERDPLESEEERRRVLLALASLSQRQRDAVLSRIVEGESFPEIARELRVSEGSVKVHFRRGVERLRALLAPFLEEIHGLR
jgi:RNA polymerase sigma-70 factor (ECF subfamily)